MVSCLVCPIRRRAFTVFGPLLTVSHLLHQGGKFYSCNQYVDCSLEYFHRTLSKRSKYNLVKRGGGQAEYCYAKILGRINTAGDTHTADTHRVHVLRCFNFFGSQKLQYVCGGGGPGQGFQLSRIERESPAWTLFSRPPAKHVKSPTLMKKSRQTRKISRFSMFSGVKDKTLENNYLANFHRQGSMQHPAKNYRPILIDFVAHQMQNLLRQ